MDKDLLLDMLELAEKEKKRWDESIRKINLELKQIGIEVSVTTRRGGRQPSSKSAKAEKRIVEILRDAQKSLSPKQITEKAIEDGAKLELPLVRQILSRRKGEKFISPERGLWELKKDEDK
ncbi:hypothetical protein AMJ44_09945 [candidate division WOR-1 bacterium DG_54_3]|uniref:Uncharacterized protein n=1 Tax=candidate division WOR-1 bacterium DG_54_3 TaxID=1703775 RepID=A0A0S7XSU0_UNCSA|nr:MAG: hypothetical protein AMJ44_09945 [candidate division WOR-1 bacterium DG_54_3]